MKTEAEIREEIEFQEQEYKRVHLLIDVDTSELQKQEYFSVMSRHAARRQALLWVLEP